MKNTLLKKMTTALRAALSLSGLFYVTTPNALLYSATIDCRLLRTGNTYQ
jgi:hypothetical protein